MKLSTTLLQRYSSVSLDAVCFVKVYVGNEREDERKEMVKHKMLRNSASIC